MKKKCIVGIALAMTFTFLLCGCRSNENEPEPVVEEPVIEEDVIDTSFYDEQFIINFAQAVEYRQDLGSRMSNALTATDVLQMELDRHPDYSALNFEDEVLKTYAVHYREALSEQLSYWKANKKKDKDWEGYKEQDYDKAVRAWLTQVDAVNSLVKEYDLPISSELAEEYQLERYFWSSGLYSVIYTKGNNTGILFEDMKPESKFNDKESISTVKLKIKNQTKYDLTGIHIYVYHLTKGGYVLEKEIPVGIWDIDSDIEKEFEVHEKYNEKDHLYLAGSGLALTLEPKLNK